MAETVKYRGVTSTLKTTFLIKDQGSIRTDQIFEGVINARTLLKIEPLTNETIFISVYRMNENQTVRVLIEQHTLTNKTIGYLDLPGLCPYQVEIKGPCKVYVRILRL
jgi:hypothetical protein